jgi:transcriptional regulator with GAF, ATPase, and Fis domain
LQSQEFRRIGDDQDRRVDVRIITATNRDLDQLVAAGGFRQDLYYRINVFPMHLPPLRDRPEDIALLVHHFVQKYRARLGKAITSVTPGALARLAAYDFPGNVRELENKIHQAMVLAAGPAIEERDLTLPPPPATSGIRVDVARPFREVKQETIDAFERGYLTELLRVHAGNLAQAARAAGMDRKNLWALVERHGLDRARFKKP